MAAVEVAFRSGFANQNHFCFNFKRVSRSAETVSDFRKNLSNIRKIIKDIGKQPCSLPSSTQVNPVALLKTRVCQSYVSIQAIPKPNYKT
jgi:hypothetical protein